MESYEELKKIFEQSFSEENYKKISLESYDMLRSKDDLCLLHSTECCPEKLKICDLIPEFNRVCNNNSVAFKITYKVCVTDFSAKRQVEIITSAIEEFISAEKYNSVSYCLWCEKESCYFVGTFLGYAKC